ncbi:hypothetical protein RJG79_08645 [Mycoplasmatota bacterium WC44]
MKDIELLGNKKFAYSCFNLLKEKGCLTQEVINILTNVDQCKRLFSCSKFPILLEVNFHDALEDADCYDTKGRQRFYKEKVYYEERAFILSNHWYGPNKSMPDNRTPFFQWVLANINL